MEKFVKVLNALLVLIISGVLISAFVVQFSLGEEPCPLCLLQRLGMIGVATGAILNLRFGVKAQHYAISLFSAIFGGVVALRQICLHICPGFPKFGEPVFGLSLYTWSFLVFICSIFYISLLLLLYRSSRSTPKNMHICSWVIFVIFFLVVVANAIATFIECSWGGC